MSSNTARLCIYLLLLTCAISVLAQQPPVPASSGTAEIVPQLVSFSGVLSDVNGKPLTGVVGVTFAMYEEQQGGAPLWLETQNVYPDKTGHYTVMLGSTTSTGIPSLIFASGEARWLGVEPQGQAEQPRVMLLAVPYALKALDAETVGGMRPSAFALANTGTAGTTTSTANTVSKAATVGGSGTSGYLAEWQSGGNLGNSVLFQSGSSVGLGTTTPTNTFTVNKGSTAGAGIDLLGSNDTRLRIGVGQPTAWSWSTGWTTPGDFSLIEEGRAGNRIYVKPGGNVGLGTSTPSTTLEVNKGATAGGGIYIDGTNDTRLKIGVGQPTVWSWSNGWTTPGDLSLVEEGKSGSRIYIKPGGNVGIGTTTPAYALDVNGTANFSGVVNFAVGSTFTGNQTVNGNLSATGLVTGAAFNIGSNLFGWGSWANGNSAVGYGGNTTMTGTNNTANGTYALSYNSSGVGNTASGYQALYDNSGGSYNTATGSYALAANSTGSDNTATGTWALDGNTTGAANTATGWETLVNNSTGSYDTATGYQALRNNTTSYNTADGGLALSANTTGADNTASGYQALTANTTGSWNTAVGFQAVESGTTPNYNTAVGYQAAMASNQSSNTAIGYDALAADTAGGWNTAIGVEALYSNVTGSENEALGVAALDSNTGSNNIGIGWFGGGYLTTGSNNIDIGDHTGVAGESGTIRIGTEGTQTATYIAGIYNANIGGNTVYIDSSGQLSSMSSSRRFKQDIRDIGDTSGIVMRLRPVRFRYKSQDKDGPEQYGLIAEEVQTVAPDLVGRGRDGQIDSVRYDKVNILLLNEVQKQHRMTEALNRQLQSQIHKQQQQIRAQQAEITRLSSQIKAIQASLKTNRQSDPEVRIAKAQVSAVPQ